MHRQIRWNVTCACLLALGFGTVGRSEPSATLLPVLTPGANIVFFADTKAMQAAPIQAKIKGARDQAQDAAAGGPLDVRQHVEKFYEALGIKEEDFESVLVAMNLDNVDPGGKTNFEELDLSVGLTLSKPLSIEAIKTGLVQLDATQARDMPLTEEVYRGVTLLVAEAEEKDAETELPRLVVSSLGDGKLIVAGSAKGVKSTIDRHQSGQTVSLDSALGNARSSIPAGSQMYMIFVPSPSLTAKFGEIAPDPQKNPLFAGAAKALIGAKSLVFSMKADTDLTGALMLTLANEMDGMQIKMILDVYVLGLGKAWLLSQAKRPIPAINSLQSIQNGSTVKLSFAITEEDVDILQSLKPAAGTTPPGAPDGEEDHGGAGQGSGSGKQRPPAAQPETNERVKIVIPQKL